MLLKHAKTRDPLWTTEVRDPHVMSIKIHNDALYVTSYGSRLYCIDATTGVIQWYYRLEKEIMFFSWIPNVLNLEFKGNLTAVATLRGCIFLFSHDVGSGQYISSKNGPRPE
jgi:outer membrane protein assembly factor BamB